MRPPWPCWPPPWSAWRCSSRSAQFLVLDGTAPHEPTAGYLQEVTTGWPQPMTWWSGPDWRRRWPGWSEEMNQRLKGTSSDRSERYVLINGLQRYREFRRSDDDVGFGRRGAERTVSPLEHLQALLRDGPLVGIHLLIWCDSLVNVMRSLDRAGLARMRAAGAVPDECGRLQPFAGLAAGQPAGSKSGLVLHRRDGPAGEVPALWTALANVAGGDQGESRGARYQRSA